MSNNKAMSQPRYTQQQHDINNNENENNDNDNENVNHSRNANKSGGANTVLLNNFNNQSQPKKSRWGPRQQQKQQQDGDKDNNNNNNSTRMTMMVVHQQTRDDARPRSNLYIPPAKRRRLEQQAEAAAARRRHEEDEEEEEGAVEVESCKKSGQGEVPLVDSSSSWQTQQEAWLAQSRKIHGYINRLSITNIRELILNLLQSVNVVKMRGCLAHSLLQAMTSTTSTQYLSVYASFLAVLHSKLPVVGQLVVHRCVAYFRQAYQRRDKARVTSTCLSLSHLFVQAVVHELLILQILTLLLSGRGGSGGGPTSDSLGVAIQILKVVGGVLQRVSPTGYRAIRDQMRSILASQRDLHPQMQTALQQLLSNDVQIFELPAALDLVELEDQITISDLDLDRPTLETHYELDTFGYDQDYDQHEAEWLAIQRELLGLDDEEDDDDSDTDDNDGDDDAGEQETEDDGDDDSKNENEQANGTGEAPKNASSSTALVQVQDLTESDLVHLRRTIYLTIMSSARADETVHKLAGIDIPDGREEELVNMLLECCAQERTFQRNPYGEIGRSFCLMHPRWRNAFEAAFAQQYATIHRLETNKLRNVSKFFAHLLHTHALPWSVFGNIRMTEDATTSSSRIFVKILLQELSQALGVRALIHLFGLDDDNQDAAVTNAAPELQDSNFRSNSNKNNKKIWFQGLFPMQGNLRETRYAINFLTSIGLGPLTDTMRQYLKNVPLIAAQLQSAQAKKQRKDDDSDESSVLSSSSSSSSSFSSSSSSTTSSSSSSSSSDDSRVRHRRKGSVSRRRPRQSRYHKQRSGSRRQRRSSGGDEGEGRRRGNKHRDDEKVHEADNQRGGDRPSRKEEREQQHRDKDREDVPADDDEERHRHSDSDQRISAEKDRGHGSKNRRHDSDQEDSADDGKLRRGEARHDDDHSREKGQRSKEDDSTADSRRGVQRRRRKPDDGHSHSSASSASDSDKPPDDKDDRRQD